MAEPEAVAVPELLFRGEAFLAVAGWQRKDSVGGAVSFANGESSFHALKFQSLAAPKVQFRLACVYLNVGQGISESPMVEDGQDCPPGTNTVSSHIMAFKVLLAGPEEDKYTVRYGANLIKAHADKPQFTEPAGPASGADGSWCGNLSGIPGFFVWINSFSVSVAPK